MNLFITNVWFTRRCWPIQTQKPFSLGVEGKEVTFFNHCQRFYLTTNHPLNAATAREVFKHRSVEKVVMVDIDKEVVEQCKKHLRKHHAGSFDDPRLEIHYEDAKKV